MTQTSLQFDQPDICQRKHGGHRNSVAANEKAAPGKAAMRERIRVFVAGCGWHGATLKEVATAMGKEKNEISGRFTALRTGGEIFDSGRDRDGCTVYVSDQQWVNGA